MPWIKCSKEAYERCPHTSPCGNFEDAFFLDGSDCDKFNQSIKPPAVDAVHISELTALRDTLYDMDAITFRGLAKVNQLIAKYGGQDSNTIPDERRWLETV